MLVFISYLLLSLCLLFFLIAVSIYVIFLIYSFISGSPYVPTEFKKINQILKMANLEKKKLFIELGCGDGRVVRTAVKNYQVQGIGVDINLLLIYQAKLLALIQKIQHKINFYHQDIFDTDLTKADYIYLFLFPNLIKKLTAKFDKELRKNTLIISHGFKIKGWGKKLIKTLPDKPFPTYYYRF